MFVLSCPYFTYDQLTRWSRLYASISFRPSKRRSKCYPCIFLICNYTPVDRFGWFWECPNGEQCQYRHALPPGFVLKSQKKALEDAEKANQISLEAFLEVEVRSVAPGFHLCTIAELFCIPSDINLVLT